MLYSAGFGFFHRQAMKLLWPDFLFLLAFIPLIIAIYVFIVRRARFTVRYSSLSFVWDAASRHSWWKRHLSFMLFLLALTSLMIASGRPVTYQGVLSGQTTIILALDVSRSMCFRDIPPNRLTVAKMVARSFVHQQVLGTQIGLVAFSGFAELAQEPTTDPVLLENAINNLTTSTQTAIGSAILRSLDAIAEVDKRVKPSTEVDSLPASSSKYHLQLPLAKENFVPHIIVLLTDGASNTGPPPLSAAQQAQERGVRIYTIGFGTTKNMIMDCWSSLDEAPLAVPGPGSPLGGIGSGPEEAVLKEIAEMTGGTYYSATSAPELQLVFQTLHHYIATTNTTIEISVLFAAMGALMGITAVILAFLWHPLL
jgi:Ca-activated chloride channel family protein